MLHVADHGSLPVVNRPIRRRGLVGSVRCEMVIPAKVSGELISGE